MEDYIIIFSISFRLYLYYYDLGRVNLAYKALQIKDTAD